MSTRCYIGLKNDDNSISSIYCHFDGYIKKGVGQKLLENYKDVSKIKQLLDLGDLSSLGTTPVDNPSAWDEYPTSDTEFVLKTFLEWQKQHHPDNLCDTYRRRGDALTDAKHDPSEEAWKKKLDQDDFYLYLFKDNKWHVKVPGSEEFVPLSEYKTKTEE